jgi:hypothetical protein
MENSFFGIFEGIHLFFALDGRTQELFTCVAGDEMSYPTATTSAKNTVASRPSSNLRRRLSRVLAAAGLALCAAVPAAAGGPLEVVLSNGRLPVSQLPVGDDLWVGLSGADPGVTYDFRLSATDGTLITGTYAAADAAGNLAPTLLWSRTGVVGCDCELGADPAAYRFKDFQQAESFLSGRSAVLQVLSHSGVQLAQVNLPLMVARREISYFSDADGCPRRIFKPGEKIYLGLLHPDRSKSGRRIYLAASKSWPLGAAIVDVRGAVQNATLPATGGDLIVLPVGGSLRQGSYDGILGNPFEFMPVRQGDDVVLDNPATTTCPEGNGGLVVTLDGCTNCQGPNYP